MVMQPPTTAMNVDTYTLLLTTSRFVHWRAIYQSMCMQNISTLYQYVGEFCSYEIFGSKYTVTQSNESGLPFAIGDLPFQSLPGNISIYVLAKNQRSYNINISRSSATTKSLDPNTVMQQSTALMDGDDIPLCCWGPSISTITCWYINIRHCRISPHYIAISKRYNIAMMMSYATIICERAPHEYICIATTII